MTLTPCIDTRDSLVQEDGRILTNDFVNSDVGLFHTVTSYCRTADGTWIAWTNENLGEESSNPVVKASWPVEIANSHAITVGFFPDDETGPYIFDLDIDPVYGWQGLPATGPTDPCAIYPLLGDRYADVGKARLISWAMQPVDIQIRTDGDAVWVVALAKESVKYPFLYNSPGEVDHCGVTHPTFEDDWAAGHSDPFFHDFDAGNRWWTYFGSGDAGSMGPFDDAGEPGHIWGGAFRWEPARVTVWAGDIGGFTKLDTIEAKFGNSSGLVSGVEACASPAEPGVLHVMWAEAGYMGPLHQVDPRNGQRINYSRWDFSGKTLDTDLAYIEEPQPDTSLLHGYVSPDDWVWTQEFILRNDHGSPIALVLPIVAGAGEWTTSGPLYAGTLEFWDLAGGTMNVLQTLDLSLYPTPAELDVTQVQAVANVTGQRRSHFASSLYTDPLLDDQDVYLVYVAFYDPSHQIGPSGEDGIIREGCAFYRIPVDGSDTFSFMDDTRLLQYSILPLAPSGPSFIQFGADFVSDPRNVWMPQMGGAAVWQLTRTCERTWVYDPCFPVDSVGPGGGGAWDIYTSKNSVTPPTWLTDDEGEWIAGGGYGPFPIVPDEGVQVDVAALRAKICRCCVPCIARVGMHVWQTL